MKHTVSEVADGAVCIGGKPYRKVKKSTTPVPHNITLFVELKVTIVSSGREQL